MCISFRFGICSSIEHEGPCSPASTSQLMFFPMTGKKCFSQACFMFANVISSSSKGTSSHAPIWLNFWAFPETCELRHCTVRFPLLWIFLATPTSAFFFWEWFCFIRFLYFNQAVSWSPMLLKERKHLQPSKTVHRQLGTSPQRTWLPARYDGILWQLSAVMKTKGFQNKNKIEWQFSAMNFFLNITKWMAILDHEHFVLILNWFHSDFVLILIWFSQILILVLLFFRTISKKYVNFLMAAFSQHIVASSVSSTVLKYCLRCNWTCYLTDHPALKYFVFAVSFRDQSLLLGPEGSES